MASERLLIRDAIGSFAPGQGLRAALLLTYSFDGKWIEEGFVPDLFDRPVANALVIRDAHRIVSEAPTVRYHRANAGFSTRVFHPKLGLFVAEDRALAVIGSANLTRGGLERNLELGSAFEVSRSGGPRPLFEGILRYITGPLMGEVGARGAAATSLRDTAVALREVLVDVPTTQENPHLFIHNYELPLWEQVLEALPHRHVARLSIVSPFFEPNRIQPEDPVTEADVGMFERMLKDLAFEPPKGEKPISVFFQQSEGQTVLPIDKLSRWKKEIELYQRLSTTQDPRPLHGKLVLIEGAQGTRREPYLLAVHGSPNFTSAAFLFRPPESNSETAVVTRLPAKRNGSVKTWTVLGLDELFGKVADWGILTHVSPVREPLQMNDAFRVTDATLNVSERKMEIIWQGRTPGAASVRALIEVNGAWIVVGEGNLVEGQRLVLDVPQFVETDEHNLLSLKSSQVRVEMLDASGGVIGSSIVPVNVDCPQQFCGTVLVGAIMSTLDERIAFAGCGAIQSYRQQLDFLEQHRKRASSPKGTPTVLTHQADLDRFFRNLQSGFLGIRARLSAMPNSEFTLRRTLKDLTQWCHETVTEETDRLSTECRLFLVDRLARELQRTLELGEESRILAPLLRSMVREFQLPATLQLASQWIDTLSDNRVRPYVEDTAHLLTVVSQLAGDGEQK
ncbi:MAG: phospholipase D family protein [Nitrospiraceae bacterium]|nr:phospholipase D family protein [Nitrospiraceae bacterium]